MSTGDHMPAAYPGNTATKPARAATGGGFESAIEVVSGTPAISSVTDNGDGTLSISGSGFGSKAQAAPVMHDIGGKVWENGTLNTLIADLADGATIANSSADPDFPYVVMSSVNTLVKNANRVAGEAVYNMPGQQAWIGKPYAYGGNDTPPSDEKHLIAWWMERKWHWYYWRISPEVAVTGTFQPGESVSVSGSTETGRFIDFESGAGLYHFEMTTRTSSNLTEKTITGDVSGAQITFPPSFRGGSGTGYETPGTKYMRVFDLEGANLLNGIFTPNDVWLRSNQYLANYDRSYPQFTPAEEPADAPNLYEWEISVDYAAYTGNTKTYINGKLKAQQSFSFGSDGHSTEQSLSFFLGNDAYEVFQRTRMHEVYFDNSIQRVYLGNASTFDACTQIELQRPTAWADTGVTVAKHEGTLTGSKWVYVRGSDGSINQNGGAV